jgi:hypothetical protein
MNLIINRANLNIIKSFIYKRLMNKYNRKAFIGVEQKIRKYVLNKFDGFYWWR